MLWLSKWCDWHAQICIYELQEWPPQEKNGVSTWERWRAAPSRRLQAVMFPSSVFKLGSFSMTLNNYTQPTQPQDRLLKRILYKFKWPHSDNKVIQSHLFIFFSTKIFYFRKHSLKYTRPLGSAITIEHLDANISVYISIIGKYISKNKLLCGVVILKEHGLNGCEAEWKVCLVTSDLVALQSIHIHYKKYNKTEGDDNRLIDIHDQQFFKERGSVGEGFKE